MMVGLYACSCAQTEDPQVAKKRKKVFSSALLLSFVKDLPDFSVFAVFFVFVFTCAVWFFWFLHFDVCFQATVDHVNEHEGE